MKIKKGDKVKVIAGKDKGKSGTVVHAFPKKNAVVVEGVALYKRHLKGRTDEVGRIIERPRAIDASNVALVASPKLKSALDAPAKGAK
ncbi:MAG: 50S ribosomal protein L24 [Parcubacteria group bacterium 20-58-5]|nr:MAG: 50S ribosomal protein L24 [Parcubacteria group bacterium 20-58-5]OYV63773.1 MAG: 50S ribosomal protein L24 [Parcubacteria group bacterium 21-58-10]HQT82833.1 50S ribosomal protein L24 [Candidatus Paceibacterota bacterium]